MSTDTIAEDLETTAAAEQTAPAGSDAVPAAGRKRATG